MYKLKTWIAFLSLLLSVGIFFIPYRKEKTVIHQEVSVNGNICITSDGEYLYTNWDVNTKRKDTRTEKLGCLYLCPTEDEKFDIQKEKIISYTGDLQDASNYVAMCKRNGYSISSISADSSFIDVKLTGTDCSIRVIYLETSGLRIMHEVAGEPVSVAPFLV